jgi:hypothetical protein
MFITSILRTSVGACLCVTIGSMVFCGKDVRSYRPHKI